MSAKILITGPGRAGTTLLVKLLDSLGFDTGSHRLTFHETARAGLETNLLSPDSPYIVKDPSLTWRLRKLIESGQVDPAELKYVLVPLRPLHIVSASRVINTLTQRHIRAKGGMVGVKSPKEQLEWLAAATYGLFETVALYEIPLVVLHYPRFATDASYAFRRLQPLMPHYAESDFDTAWNSVVDLELAQSEPPPLPSFVEARVRVIRLRTWFSTRYSAMRQGD